MCLCLPLPLIASLYCLVLCFSPSAKLPVRVHPLNLIAACASPSSSCPLFLIVLTFTIHFVIILMIGVIVTTVSFSVPLVNTVTHPFDGGETLSSLVNFLPTMHLKFHHYPHHHHLHHQLCHQHSQVERYYACPPHREAIQQRILPMLLLL